MANTHHPRKRFGQNFLQDTFIISEIMRVFNPQSHDRVIEIGPGLGALTKPLLRYLPSFTVIEVDRDLQKHLVTIPQLQVINADALSVDYSVFGTNLRIIGNLPYNISTPLILHLLHAQNSISDMHFMLQKEVVTRLAATPGSKAYGRLSVMVQYFCEVEPLFDVLPTAFYPAPKVESTFVRLTPHLVCPYPDTLFADLERLVAKAFAMRRKTLSNNLKAIVTPAMFAALNIDPRRRPEELSVLEYAQLATLLVSRQH